MLPNSTFVNNTNKTVYINPNFKGHLPIPETVQPVQTTNIPKNAHINPLFLKSQRCSNAIHMNPAFLQKFRQEKEQLPEVPKTYIPHIVTRNASVGSGVEFKTVSSSEIKLPNEARKIICKSKNVLIREPLIKYIAPTVRPNCAPAELQPLLVLNKRKLIRKVPLLPGGFTVAKTVMNCDFKTRVTKYKLDNRLLRKKPLLPPTPRIKRTSFVARYALRRSSVNGSHNTSIKKSFTENMNRKLEVLNINGLLYKSTRNSLKLKNVASRCVSKSYNAGTNGKTSSNASQGLTIFVRGSKYVMDENKFKLTRVTNCDPILPNRTKPNKFCKGPTCQRIDIGGYTYVSTSSTKNVLIRTTNHLSRAYVHNAKQKSLQTLAKRLVKTNIPCPIFQRIGKCAAFERGKCSKVHNKLQVAICSKFLRGECHNSECLMSHNVSLSKMPVCKFYLQGVCVRNDCPYLHKKLSDTTELCTEFLRGFCQKADKCNKRHEFVCPEVERNNKCTIKNCLYCNAKKRKELQIKQKSEKLKSETAASSTLFSTSKSKEVTESQSCKRYFLETGGNPAEKNEENSKNNMDSNENLEENAENIVESRPKLGALPAFIPL